VCIHSSISSLPLQTPQHAHSVSSQLTRTLVLHIIQLHFFGTAPYHLGSHRLRIRRTVAPQRNRFAMRYAAYDVQDTPHTRARAHTFLYHLPHTTLPHTPPTFPTTLHTHTPAISFPYTHTTTLLRTAPRAFAPCAHYTRTAFRFWRSIHYSVPVLPILHAQFVGGHALSMATHHTHYTPVGWYACHCVQHPAYFTTLPAMHIGG